jgi:hypothetical protein
VRSFVCDVCGRLLVFENSVCVHCGTPVGFDVGQRRLVPAPVDGSMLRCANADLAGCNWLLPAPGGLCACCALTRTRPSDDDVVGLGSFARAEAAKRRLCYQLLDLGLPLVDRYRDARRGLAFDLLSSAWQPVTTGQVDGVVTIDLAEGQDAHREAMRVELAEPYRTLLGHLRHEVGHYYWTVLVAGNGLLPTDPDTLVRFRQLFGDERPDYAAALERHYASGPPAGWADRHVSAYAAAHPWEDWAETFAHYLHIGDTLQTAGAYGMVVTGPEVAPVDAAGLVAVPSELPRGRMPFRPLIDTWLPLTYALNAVNRSMGAGDLYPFVLTPVVIEKLAFVHELVEGGRPGRRLASAPRSEPRSEPADHPSTTLDPC